MVTARVVGQAVAAGPAELPAEAIRQIEAAVAEEMSKQGIPGMSVAVGVNGRLVWSKGFGLADVENDVPVTSETMFRLASISKPVTAVAVMKLVEEGRLDLDWPIQEYCPTFPDKPWPVTVRQLLGHLSGVRHYSDAEDQDEVRTYAGVVDGLSKFAKDPLCHEPGKAYTYTTYGYTVLGCAVEGASGKSYETFVLENVWTKAGATTARAEDRLAVIPHRAAGYSLRRGVLGKANFYDNSYKLPGGGWISTASDLVRFADALFVNGDLLARETVEAILTPLKTSDGASTDYGLGWSVEVQEGERLAWHSGGQNGVTTRLMYLPERRAVVAVMCNLGSVRLQDLVKRIGRIAAPR
jgi:CubicO group peptidase (beta-lactamase class C family)